MVGVFVFGFVLWGARQVIASRLVEQQAEASYKQAVLVREVAEYALKEYEQGLHLQARASLQGQLALNDPAKPQSDMPILRWKGNTWPEFVEQRADLDSRQESSKEQQVRSLRSDVEKARADEASKRAIYQQERARATNSPVLIP